MTERRRGGAHNLDRAEKGLRRQLRPGGYHRIAIPTPAVLRVFFFFFRAGGRGEEALLILPLLLIANDACDSSYTHPAESCCATMQDILTIRCVWMKRIGVVCRNEDVTLPWLRHGDQLALTALTCQLSPSPTWACGFLIGSSGETVIRDENAKNISNLCAARQKKQKIVNAGSILRASQRNISRPVIGPEKSL